jgi:hypothetical protein
MILLCCDRMFIFSRCLLLITGIRDEEMKTAFNFEKAHKWRAVAQQMLSDMLEKYRSDSVNMCVM